MDADRTNQELKNILSYIKLTLRNNLLLDDDDSLPDRKLFERKETTNILLQNIMQYRVAG
ncbi:hypothetical protein ACMUMS_05320 [Acinetobacter courvalinii]|uniref:hypothetical protein n=1 Tax=Acinetobacter courvalinii TaxID=280147 RepID=UPI003A8C7188